MDQPFIGLIAAVGFNFAPRGWAFCAGQILPIAQNQALFSLLGTTYGGNGQTTFALPDLRGRAALSSGQGIALQNYTLGEVGGSETVALTQQEMPPHSHMVGASSSVATIGAVNGNFLADTSVNAYREGNPGAPVPMANMIGNSGQSLPHSNQQPYLVLNFIIALQGIFPSRN
jgi:microcystin-dependent protein